RDLCLTNNLRVTPNACRFYSDLKFVFTAQWFSLGFLALSHLNWALCKYRYLKGMSFRIMNLITTFKVCSYENHHFNSIVYIITIVPIKL
ncbi:hypothetical protein FCV43_18420, partial [Vibrio genomosp. F6]